MDNIYYGNKYFLFNMFVLCVFLMLLSFLCKKQKQGVGGEDHLPVVLYVKTNATTNSTGFLST